MYNTIVTAGYLVSDPEMREVGGSKVCKMRMCISDNKAKDPCFIDVEVWDRQAEVANTFKFLNTGGSKDDDSSNSASASAPKSGSAVEEEIPF